MKHEFGVFGPIRKYLFRFKADMLVSNTIRLVNGGAEGDDV